ncbi:MAG: hypothetical protein AAF841_13550, partial [Pseudomonadota bacterium]
MALPKVKQDLTDLALARGVPGGGPWLRAARAAAQARVARLGMPIKRDEYWKFTSPDPWTGPQADNTAAGLSDVFDAAEPLTLVFTDGVFDAEASDEDALENLTVEPLRDVAHTDLHWAKSLYGSLEAASNEAEKRSGARLFKPVARPLAALNTAYAEEGLLIHATGEVTRPIRIAYRTTGGDALVHLKSDTSTVFSNIVLQSVCKLKPTKYQVLRLVLRTFLFRYF